MKLPDFGSSSIEHKRKFVLQELPSPLTRMDEHWQIFDDYAAWPEYRIRQIRIPKSREWFRYREEIKNAAGIDTTRESIPDDGTGAAMHPDKEIRKNRYFFSAGGREYAIDVFLGTLWGLVMAEISFSTQQEKTAFPFPAFAAFDVSDNEVFRGENLVELNFEQVREKIAGNSE
jgi:CYTH domain-containing protein